MVSATSLRRAFVAVASLTGVFAQLEDLLNPDFPPLLDASFNDLTLGLNFGTFTSLDLVGAYIKRILEVNATLHVVNEINPDAWSIAKQLDTMRAQGRIMGPLHGIPILLKDDIATADKMDTTAGSYALVGAKVSEDSFVAKKLRKAGAILLGKTNMAEWNGLRSTNSSFFNYSPYGGEVSGAYYPEMDPGGGSAGSVVATSIGLAFGAIGTAFSFSILNPSDSGNVVSIMPTVGLVSRDGIIDMSTRQGNVGPIGRSVMDTARLLQAIIGPDPADNYTSLIPWANGSSINPTPDYAAACNLLKLQGKRIGVPRNMMANITAEQSEISTAFEAALQTLRDAGATIVDNTNITSWDDYITEASSNTTTINEIENIDTIAEFKVYLSKLTTNPNNLTDLASVLKYTQTDPREQYSSLSTDSFENTLIFANATVNATIWASYQKLLSYGDGYFATLKANKLDAFVLPTGYVYDIPTIAQAPIISVPLGFLPANTATALSYNHTQLLYPTPNYPFGIAFAGDKWSEEKLIGMAYAFEQKTKVRGLVKPRVLPKTELEDVVGKPSGVI